VADDAAEAEDDQGEEARWQAEQAENRDFNWKDLQGEEEEEEGEEEEEVQEALEEFELPEELVDDPPYHLPAVEMDLPDLSNYNRFCFANRAQVAQDRAGLRGSELQRVLARMWRSLGEDEKQAWKMPEEVEDEGDDAGTWFH
jgi:hypothetical protein